MPIEELVFFVVVPVCTLLTIESVRNVMAGRVRPPVVSRFARPRAPVEEV
jgi:hypothetical protein